MLHASPGHASHLQVDENKQYVIHVEVSNWERGLSERRLELTLDSCGIVVSVSALSSLFGFQPQQLVGTCVSSIVDVLSELHDDLQNVLAKMARKVRGLGSSCLS